MTETVEDELPEQCQAFVEQNWVALAAAAWRHHQRHERRKGALIIAIDSVRSWARGAPLQLSLNCLRAVAIDEVDVQIAIHEPKTSIVVVFTDDKNMLDPGLNRPMRTEDGSRFMSWIFTYDPPPPEVFRLKAN